MPHMECVSNWSSGGSIRIDLPYILYVNMKGTPTWSGPDSFVGCQAPF